MTDLDLRIEALRPVDAAAVEKLHARAFGPGRYARTAFRIREQAGPAAGIGFVARVGSLLVGSVAITPIRIGAIAAFMLGPLAVEPAFEGRGIGSRLMAEAAEAARQREATLMLLVGDASYYSRFGYRPVPPGQITLPGPVDPARLLALELVDGALASTRGAARGG